MEPWEELDVDDSDLHSLLRPSTLLPCKRHLPLQQPLKPTTFIISSSCTLPLSLEPCSQLHRPSQSQNQIHNPETLNSQSDHCLPQVETSEVEVEKEEEQQQQGPSTSSLRLLPGPAGALQAAMHQHSRYREQNFFSSQERISTQEFLRGAHEGGDGDEDFRTNSWLCALDFIGGGDGVALRSPLHSIKLSVGIEKVPQVVAVIKSCVPNGLGDLIVSLKYPMGTISASIHHKVLTESEFGKDISVGAVMILKEVVLFSPSSSACYLNITLHNVVKVFNKECGPPPKQNYHVSRDRFAASGREQSGEIRPENVERTSHLRDRTADGITAGLVRRDDNDDGTIEVDREMGEGGLAAGSFRFRSNSRDSQHAAREREPLSRWGVAEKNREETVRIDANDDGTMEVDREMGEGGLAAGSFCFRSNSRESKHAAREKVPLARWGVAEKTRGDTVRIDAKHVSFGSFHSNSSGYQNAPKVVGTDMVKDPNDQEAGITNGVKKLPIVSSTSLPEWTDDQLEELFAAGSEDSDPLFS